MILINCGATEDVTQLVEVQENVRVIVIDSHRPFHHNWNDDDCKSLLAFCNPADGSCDNIPEADTWSGTSQAADHAASSLVDHGSICYMPCFVSKCQPDDMTVSLKLWVCFEVTPSAPSKHLKDVLQISASWSHSSIATHVTTV